MTVITFVDLDHDPAAKQYVTDTKTLGRLNISPVNLWMNVDLGYGPLFCYFCNHYKLHGDEGIEADVYKFSEPVVSQYPLLEGYRIIVLYS